MKAKDSIQNSLGMSTKLKFDFWCEKNKAEFCISTLKHLYQWYNKS